MTSAEALRLHLLLETGDDPELALVHACEGWVREASSASWGYSRRMGNAYADRDVQAERKAPVEALDVAREDAPHG